MQANLAEVPSTSAADGAAAAPISAARAAAAMSGGMPAGAATGNAFVINLVSSTTPVVLTRPDHAGLKRFTFFVSRRREDGRERFRLHMGYFDTQEEAEKLLDIVRTIYPGAWAGLAPGRRLAGGGAPVAGSTAAGSTAAGPTVAAPTVVASTTVASTVVASPTAAAAPAAAPAAASTPPRALPRLIEAQPLALVPDQGRRQLSDVTLDIEEPVGERERQAARSSFGNVRDAIASLADSAIRAPALSEIPELKPAVIPVARPVVRPVQAPQARPQQARAQQVQARAEQAKLAPQAADRADLTDTATLRLLESGDPAKTAKMPAVAQPMRSAPAPAPREEKSWYAVQLMWAVQPIALAQVPQLAIFSAYTLYGAEGNRDGRRWYGLRLGFFTDAVSAKQVAHYVRGDFATVSVVPVTAREREHALQAVVRSPGKTMADATGATNGHTAEATGAGSTAAASAARVKGPEFAFIEGTESQITRLRSSPGAAGGATRLAQTRPAQSSSSAARPGTPLVGGKRPSRGAPGKRAKPRPAGQVHARSRAKPRTLEETLEILGAGELQVADGSAGLLGESSSLTNDFGAGQLKADAAKAKSSSKLARLIDRLAERIGN